MKLIGLTGGVGMGKSTVADYLKRRSERVIDTDVLARELVRPGQPALEEIRREFGESVLQANGELSRAALARVVFAEEGRRRALHAILHPRIRAAWREQAEQCRAQGMGRVVVVIPLLFEMGAEAELDGAVCVGCSPPTQVKRLRERGWSEEEMEQRIRAQWPVSRKMDLAGGVIWNEGSLEVCHEQTARVFAKEN